MFQRAVALCKDDDHAGFDFVSISRVADITAEKSTRVTVSATRCGTKRNDLH